MSIVELANPARKCERIWFARTKYAKTDGEKLDIHQRNRCFGDFQTSERSHMNNILTSFVFSMLTNHVLLKSGGANAHHVCFVFFVSVLFNMCGIMLDFGC